MSISPDDSASRAAGPAADVLFPFSQPFAPGQITDLEAKVLQSYYEAVKAQCATLQANSRCESVSSGESLGWSSEQSSVVPSTSVSRRSRRRRRKKVVEVATGLDPVATGSTVSSVVSFGQPVNECTPLVGNGKCYEALLCGDYDLGVNPTFRQLLSLPKVAFRSRADLAETFISRVSPGLYHIAHSGPSALDTLAYLSSLAAFPISIDMRDVRYKPHIIGKVQLDDKLGGLGDMLSEYAQSVINPPKPQLPEAYHDADEGTCYFAAVLPERIKEAFEILGSRPTFSSILSAKRELFRSENQLEDLKLERTDRCDGVSLFHCAPSGPSLLATLLTLAVQHTYPVDSLGDKLLGKRRTVDLRYQSYVRATDRLGARGARAPQFTRETLLNRLHAVTQLEFPDSNVQWREISNGFFFRYAGVELTISTDEFERGERMFLAQPVSGIDVYCFAEDSVRINGTMVQNDMRLSSNRNPCVFVKQYGLSSIATAMECLDDTVSVRFRFRSDGNVANVVWPALKRAGLMHVTATDRAANVYYDYGTYNGAAPNPRDEVIGFARLLKIVAVAFNVRHIDPRDYDVST